MDELIALSNKTLTAMPDGVRVPRYDRNALTPGIVHIGLGNFHRAHQAWYLHRLFDAGQDHDWAIIGAGVRAGDAAQRDRLAAQDYLTTLIELDPSGPSVEVCGSMIDFLPVEPDNAALIARMAQPDIRIVSLTVTEGGYFIDPSTGGFDATHPDIVHDAENPASPRTAFGAIVAALRLRREVDEGPFTCLSCDNLQGNGRILRQTVCSLARLADAELADWIEANSTFPNSMVDCIVPATGDAERALAKGFGINDAAPVTHENFRQWVIEDEFCAGRPALDQVGATFAEDVHDYEAMKLRILNGGHQIIAAAGDLLGLKTISEAMSNTAISGLLHHVVTREIAPHVAPVPGRDPLSYLALIEGRFSNEKIVDTTRRVAFDGSSRQPGFIIPSIRDGLASGASVDGLALVSAIWARYCAGTREDGSTIEPNDPFWPQLQATAEIARDEPSAWLAMRQYYGDLGQDSQFSEAFQKALREIYAKGVQLAITVYLKA